MHLYDSVLLRSAQLLKWPNHWKTKCLLWVKLWSPLPVVLQISTGKIQSFQLRLFGNFVCRQKISLHTVHIWFSWSCLFTSLTLRKLLMLHTLLTIDNEPFSPLNFISVTTPFHFGRFVTSHCGGLFPGETMRDYSSQQLFASGLCLCFLGHWAARAVLFFFSLYRCGGWVWAQSLWFTAAERPAAPLCLFRLTLLLLLSQLRHSAIACVHPRPGEVDIATGL